MLYMIYYKGSFQSFAFREGGPVAFLSCSGASERPRGGVQNSFGASGEQSKSALAGFYIRRRGRFSCWRFRRIQSRVWTNLQLEGGPIPQIGIRKGGSGTTNISKRPKSDLNLTLRCFCW